MPETGHLLNVTVRLEAAVQESVVDYLTSQPLAPTWTIRVVEQPASSLAARHGVTVTSPELLDQPTLPSRRLPPRQQLAPPGATRSIVVVREPSEHALARVARRPDVAGLVSVTNLSSELGRALEAIGGGGIWVSGTLWPALRVLLDVDIESPETLAVLERLTPAELNTLKLLSEGLPNAKIAERRRITVRTTKFHVENLLAKTGCRSRAELVALAYRMHLC